MQQTHRSGDLYMIILMGGSSVNPQISEVINPFDMCQKMELDFRTDKLVLSPIDVAGA